MKKIVLLTAALAFSASTLFAGAEFKALNGEGRQAPSHRGAKAVEAADTPDDGFLVFGYCNGYYTAIGPEQAGLEVKAAIRIPDATAKQWKGFQIEKIRIGYGFSVQKEVEVFISSKINSEPVYTQTAEMEVSDGWNEVDLDTPFEITGSSFFVGYSVETKDVSDYPIGIDGYPTSNPNAAYIFNGEGWLNANEMYGAICIQLVISGENLPQYDLAVTGIDYPSTVLLGDELPVFIQVQNNGSRNVSEVELTGTIADKEISGLSAVLDPAVISPGSYGWLEVSGVKSAQEGVLLPLNLTISSVNGVADETPANNTATGAFNCTSTGYDPAIVVEEWTGNWCGWCPRGIVAMNYMETNYEEDGFIGIAIHGNNGPTKDPMTIASYSEFINKYAVSMGYPGCIMNRNTNFILDPSVNNLQNYFLYLKQIPAYGQIDLTADFSFDEPDAIKVSTESMFGLDIENSQHAIAFVVMENGVGPYYQTNYYSGTGELGEWGTSSRSVRTLYNHVARSITSVWGLSGSVPATVKKGETYKYETTVPVSGITVDKTTQLPKIGECSVVALLLNTESGEVVNASKFKMTDASKVEQVGATPSATIKVAQGGLEICGEYAVCSVYTVDGKNVAIANGNNFIALPSGIYIAKLTDISGTVKTTKLLVK